MTDTTQTPTASSSAPSAAPAPAVDVSKLALSPATSASVSGLTIARGSVTAWTKNLEQALADDVDANPPRLTPDEAGAVAKAYDVQAPPPPGSAPIAVETTPAANQAASDALAAKAAAAAAPAPAPAPAPAAASTAPASTTTASAAPAPAA